MGCIVSPFAPVTMSRVTRRPLSVVRCCRNGSWVRYCARQLSIMAIDDGWIPMRIPIPIIAARARFKRLRNASKTIKSIIDSMRKSFKIWLCRINHIITKNNDADRKCRKCPNPANQLTCIYNKILLFYSFFFLFHKQLAFIYDTNETYIYEVAIHTIDRTYLSNNKKVELEMHPCTSCPIHWMHSLKFSWRFMITEVKHTYCSYRLSH